MLTAVHSLNGYQQFYHRVMTLLHLQGCPIASIALVHLCLSSVSTSIEISVCCNLYTCMHWLTLIDGYKRQWPRGRVGPRGMVRPRRRVGRRTVASRTLAQILWLFICSSHYWCDSCVWLQKIEAATGDYLAAAAALAFEAAAVAVAASDALPVPWSRCRDEGRIWGDDWGRGVSRSRLNVLINGLAI